jgi:hypothetical protein
MGTRVKGNVALLETGRMADWGVYSKSSGRDVR